MINEMKRAKLLKQNTNKIQKISQISMNIEKNEFKEKEGEEKKQIIQYYPIGTKSNGQAIYLATNDTIQFTVNNNNCINYIPSKAKESNNSKNLILPQKCIEISLNNTENKKIPENEIINFIYNQRINTNSQPKNIIKVNKIKNSAFHNYLTHLNESYTHKSNITDEMNQKKLTKIENSKNQTAKFNKKLIQLDENTFTSNKNMNNKILQKNEQFSSLKGIFSDFYDENLEKERKMGLSNPMNRSASLLENRSTTLDYSYLKNGLKILEDGNFISSMKNSTRKNGLLNAIEKFKRYKSLGKINTSHNKVNLSNNCSNNLILGYKNSKNAKKISKINKNEDEENRKTLSNTLSNVNYTYILTEENKENRLKNNENKYFATSSNNTIRNNVDEINNSFVHYNTKKKFETINSKNNEKPKRLLEDIGLINKKFDPIKISLNSHITDCNEFSNKNYICSTVNTDSSQSNNKKYQYFNKGNSINNLNNFNSLNINSTRVKINNNTAKNENLHKKIRTINSSENKISLENKGKNTYSLTSIFSSNSNNQKKIKNNPRKFYIRKLLREEHYYIDEDGREKVFEVKHSLLNNNKNEHIKNQNAKNTPIKDDHNRPKKTKKIYVNIVNNKQNSIKNTIPLSGKKIYTYSLLPEKNDNEIDINIHNPTKNLARNNSQIQEKTSNLSNKYTYNTNFNSNIANKYNGIYYNNDNFNNNDSRSTDDKIENLKYSKLVKKNSFVNNQRYLPLNSYKNNSNHHSRIGLENNKLKDVNNISRKGTNSLNYSNHSYYEIKSTAKQKSNRVYKNESELQDIFANNKADLNKNRYLITIQSPIRHLDSNTSMDRIIDNKNENTNKLFNNKSVKGIKNLDFSDINFGRNINNENRRNTYSNYKISVYKGKSNIYAKLNKNYY